MVTKKNIHKTQRRIPEASELRPQGSRDQHDDVQQLDGDGLAALIALSNDSGKWAATLLF